MSQVSGFDSDCLQVHVRPLRITQESVTVVQADWHVVSRPDSPWGVVLWEQALSEKGR